MKQDDRTSKCIQIYWTDIPMPSSRQDFGLRLGIWRAGLKNLTRVFFRPITHSGGSQNPLHAISNTTARHSVTIAATTRIHSVLLYSKSHSRATASRPNVRRRTVQINLRRTLMIYFVSTGRWPTESVEADPTG